MYKCIKSGKYGNGFGGVLQLKEGDCLAADMPLATVKFLLECGAIGPAKPVKEIKSKPEIKVFKKSAKRKKVD